MRIIDCIQGSPEWLEARLGIPSASNFDRIMTPKSMKPSSSQDKYLAELVAEWFLGNPVNDFQSGFMERGTGLESEAASYYALESDAKVSEVGFCIRDDVGAGASPDRLVGEMGLLEIKCPSAATHIGYMMNESLLTDEYMCQTQGQLWICEREWVDLLAFHPTLPHVRVRVIRNEEFIKALAGCMVPFVKRLNEAKAKLEPIRERERIARMEWQPDEAPDPFASTGEPISVADLFKAPNG